MTGYKNILFTYAFSDVLKELVNLFKLWQSNNLSITDVIVNLNSLYETLNQNYLDINLKDIQGVHFEELKSLWITADTNSFLSKHTIIKDPKMYNNSITHLKRLASILRINLEDRFSFANHVEAMKIFDLKYMIQQVNETNRATWGEKEFSQLYKFYTRNVFDGQGQPSLSKSKWKTFIDTWDKASGEYRLFKRKIFNNFSKASINGKSNFELWEDVIANYSSGIILFIFLNIFLVSQCTPFSAKEAFPS